VKHDVKMTFFANPSLNNQNRSRKGLLLLSILDLKLVILNLFEVWDSGLVILFCNLMANLLEKGE
jgi:hypothetical protein